MRVLSACIFMFVLSGCATIDPAPLLEIDSLPDVFTYTQWDGTVFSPVDAPTVDVGLPVRFAGECAGTCPLNVSLAPLPADAYYEVRVAWDGTQTADMGIGADGIDQRGFDSRRVLAHEGPFSIIGNGTVSGRIAILGPDMPSLAGEALLPNIVTYAPVQVAVGTCDEVEQSEQGAQKCLRLGNAIGNTGDGPLQAVLEWDDGALAPTGLGSFDQEIRLRDGGIIKRPVGNAAFHPTHGHFHYDGFARFSLYEWDEETGLRGALATEHKKSGFCFLDWGAMEDPDREPQQSERAEDDCLVPGDTGWTMGVSSGWFDFYWSALTDQYVDIAGVPAGTYELVSVADWGDSLLEVDETDNAASAIIRLDGDAEVLEPRSFYEVPEGTANL